MKENIKIGLLGLIAVVSIYHTFLQSGHSVKEAKAEMYDDHAGHDHDHDHGDRANSQPIMNDATATPPAPAKPKGPTTSVKFAESEYSFGKIKQDTENKHIFKFTNTGKEPLLIENARGSCGCTVPKYPKEPIAPGATGDIEVVYKPGKQKGMQTKTVTITANTEPSTTMIKISAEVEEG